MKSIDAKELQARMSDSDTDEVLIDVREPFEHKGARIPEAENIPLGKIHEAAEKLKGVGTVYVHCASGNRSKQACEVLMEHGVNVVNVEGGITAWSEAGFQVIEKKGTIPIMRQVMIVAGSLVLIGAMLGTWVHPWWFGLSAFVGAGLLFAGVTGICSMTYVLKLMPWNKV